MLSEKIGGRYYLWVKWVDDADTTCEPRSDILKSVTDPELLQQIEDAVQRYRDQHNEHRDHVDDSTARGDEIAEDAYEHVPTAAEERAQRQSQSREARQQRREGRFAVNLLETHSLEFDDDFLNTTSSSSDFDTASTTFCDDFSGGALLDHLVRWYPLAGHARIEGGDVESLGVDSVTKDVLDSLDYLFTD